MAARIGLVDGRVYHFFFEARALWIHVAVKQTDDIRPIPRQVGAHHEVDALTRLDTETVRIPNEVHVLDGLPVGR